MTNSITEIQIAERISKKIEIAGKLSEELSKIVDMDKFFNQDNIRRRIENLGKVGTYLEESISCGYLDRDEFLNYLTDLSNHGYEKWANLNYGEDLVDYIMKKLRETKKQ